MSMIQIENLSFCYPGSYDPVFENVSLQLDTDWKLGLIGRNGRGKTTLLRLLNGELVYEGRIASTAGFDYFPYPVIDGHRRTDAVLREICPMAEDWELMCELSRLEVNYEVLKQSFDTLSNGERTKLMLAALFLNEGRFLLIDEPTNHLDAHARALVARYLQRKNGFILVSHDRAFLDGCVDHILSINRTSIEVQAGNYSSWKRNFDRQQAFERDQDERLKRSIVHLKEAARRSAGWSDRVEATKHERNSGVKADKGYIGHKAAKMMQRSKASNARREREIAERSALLKNSEEIEVLKLQPLRHPSERLVELRDVRISYDGRAICGPIHFTLHRGERIAIDGANGSGKSSLLKLILGMDVPHSGEIISASGLKISYVAQDTSGLQGSLFDHAQALGIDESLYLAILRKMGFSRVQFEKNIQDFSSGQKKKALIAASLCQQAHLYIWDEPLNFIDIDSRIQIEDLLRRFQPTMLCVEHDRVFRETIATGILEL